MSDKLTLTEREAMATLAKGWYVAGSTSIISPNTAQEVQYDTAVILRLRHLGFINDRGNLTASGKAAIKSVKK